MLIVNALNITSDKLRPEPQDGVRPDGTSDYHVSVFINRRTLWEGTVKNHIRAQGASVLLRLIADAMDAHPQSKAGETLCGKCFKAGCFGNCDINR